MDRFLCADYRVITIASSLDFVQYFTIGGGDLHNTPLPEI